MEEISVDPKRKVSTSGFISRYFSDIRTISLIVLTLTLAGIVTFNNLAKELNPAIKIPIVTISTVYPGASPEDVNELITVPIEDAVSGLDGITKTSSTSQEGLSLVTLEFTSSTDPEKAKTEVQGKVDTVTGIPEEAFESDLQLVDFQNQPVITFAIAGNVDSQTLRQGSQLIEDRLNDISAVEKVTLRYEEPLEVRITLDQQKISAQNIAPQSITAAVKQSLQSVPGGSVATTHNTYAVGIERKSTSLEEVRNLPVNIEGTVLPLASVATVTEVPEKESPLAWLGDTTNSAKRMVLFSVYKTDSADATETVAAINSALQDVEGQYNHTLKPYVIFDGAREIKKSFDQLFRDFFITVGLVFVVLILFFGVRQSVVSSLAIPLTFLITFIIMGIAGISVNFIALFALLLALGILVDNVIVIISAMASYERVGHHTPAESALLVWQDFKAVIFTTTITTIWAFLPLLLATGIIGEFIKPIPIVVSSALAVSAAIALFIVIPVMATLQTGQFARRVILFAYTLCIIFGALLVYALIPKGPYSFVFFVVIFAVLALLVWQRVLIQKNKTNPIQESVWSRKWEQVKDKGFFDLHPLAMRYESFIRTILQSKQKRRITGIILTLFALFSYALLPAGLVVNEFFPEDDQETIYASVTLAKGSSLEEATQKSIPLLEELRTLPDVKFVTAEVGAGVPTDSGFNNSDNSNLLFTIILVPKGERDQTSGDFVKNLNNRYSKSYPHGDFSASQLSGGPPAGSDIQIKLLGENREALIPYIEQLEEYLKKQNGVSDVKSSLEVGSGKIVFTPRAEKLLALGISESEVAFWLRALGNGVTVAEDVRFDEEKRDVVLRVHKEAQVTPETLSSFQIPTKEGLLPLSSLGDFSLATNPTRITREDGKITLSVSAAVAEGTSVSITNKELETFADNLNLPEGITWKTGGVNEENDKSVQSILQAMVLSAILIFATMTIQFRSFRKSLIALLVIPLAICGVFIVFALFGIPLSFPALIGILALFGIVVNNSIIMVDKINRNLETDMPLIEAVSQGAASRLEPILLTALTTIIGLIPITLSDPIWQGLGGAIIAGLLFSGLAKLFMIPLLYFVFYGEKES